ncbi:MAG: hypothetical protein FWG87_10460 [Defluviitaleaceae bacterium]|nr:hypothetical protein [Defluviitaleaceae bacterium]
MKTTILSRILIAALFAALIFFAVINKEESLPQDMELISALQGLNRDLAQNNSMLVSEARSHSAMISQLETDLAAALAQAELAQESLFQEEDDGPTLRVYYNGNSDVWLNVDGTFILNYFDHAKISGTYTERTESGRTTVRFTHNGGMTVDGRDAVYTPTSFEPVTVVGTIAGNVLHLPTEWDEGFGTEYRLRVPLVFVSESDNRITLNVDRTFTAEFYDNVLIVGVYAPRARAYDYVSNDGIPQPYFYNSITFIHGMPVFNTSGSLQSAAFAVPVTNGNTLTIPEPWVGIAGAETFSLVQSAVEYDDDDVGDVGDIYEETEQGE